MSLLSKVSKPISEDGQQHPRTLMMFSPVGSLDQSDAILDSLFPCIPFSLEGERLLISVVPTLLSLRIQFSWLPRWIGKCWDGDVVVTCSSGCGILRRCLFGGRSSGCGSTLRLEIWHCSRPMLSRRGHGRLQIVEGLVIGPSPLAKHPKPHPQVKGNPLYVASYRKYLLTCLCPLVFYMYSLASPKSWTFSK